MKKLIAVLTAVLLLMAFVVTPAFAGEEKTADTSAKVEKVDKVAKDTTAAKVEKVARVSAVPKTEAPKMITTPSGLRYEDIKVGTGKVAIDSMMVQCHYTLWLADSTGLVKGKMLQSSKDRGMVMACQLGVGLIAGWSEGMMGMKEGGVRTLYVPWKLGYGEPGRPPMIPSKANLIFEIEFVKAI
jgi:FKBP-type peptidyl-prolyl cis-trans isomerase